MFEEELKTIRSMNKREVARQVVLLGQSFSFAIILWKLAIFILCTDSPIVVVLSGSMEPGYYRGDGIFLSMWQDDVAVGDVVVYKVRGRDIPIVHRIHRVHAINPHDYYDYAAIARERFDTKNFTLPWTIEGGDAPGRFGGMSQDAIVNYLIEEERLRMKHSIEHGMLVLTKGDNNMNHDRDLYNPGQHWISVSDIMGRPRSYVPQIGMLTIWMSENKWLQWIVIFSLVFFMLASKERS